MLKLENHNFTTIMVKIKSGKNNDKWVLNLRGNFDEKQNSWHSLKVYPHRLLISFKEKHHNYTVGKPDTTLTK